MAIELRPEVRAFAEAMQRLRRAGHDGRCMMSTLYIVSNADVIFVDTREGTMALTEQQIVALRRWAEAVASISPYQQERIVAMCEELLTVRAERDTLRAMLRRLEWLDMGHAYPICPVCEGHEHEGHAAGCELAALSATPAPDGRRDAANERSA